MGGYCNAASGDPPCPTGYCCVFNTYYSSAPYACMKCTTPSKRHCQKKWFVVIRIRRSTSLIRENWCSILFILAIPPICNTETTTTITTTTTTETILPCCAGTCNGVASYYPNTTSCGLTCLDPGGFRCLSGSTYCAGGSFDLGGYCNAANGDPPCPTGYCCVFNTYYSSAPYACMKCTTPSK